MKQFNLEEYLKNPSRKVVTRLGKPVIIHCTNYDASCKPVIAEIEGSNRSTTFSISGAYNFGDESIYDLFFAPEKHEGWVNVFEDVIGVSYAGTRIFKSKEDAEKNGKNWNGYIATVKIEWEE